MFKGSAGVPAPPEGGRVGGRCHGNPTHIGDALTQSNTGTNPLNHPSNLDLAARLTCSCVFFECFDGALPPRPCRPSGGVGVGGVGVGGVPESMFGEGLAASESVDVSRRGVRRIKWGGVCMCEGESARMNSMAACSGSGQGATSGGHEGERSARV